MSIFHTRPESEFYTDERCHIIEIVNTSEHPNISMAQARVLPGVHTASHLLNGTTEWYYILEGQGDMYLGNVLVGRLNKGDVVHIPPGKPQSIHNIGQEDLVFLCICTPRFQPRDYVQDGN